MTRQEDPDSRRDYLLARIRGRRRDLDAADLTDIAQDRTLTSFAQDRIWFIEHLNTPSALFNEAVAARITGVLYPVRFETAFNAVLATHSACRTGVTQSGGKPVLVEGAAPRLELKTTASEHEALMQAEAIARAPFDLASPPLYRGVLYRISETSHVFVLTCHHIVSDALSRVILSRQIAQAYNGHRVGAPAFGPADFAARQRWEAGQPAALERLQWWQAMLEGVTDLDPPYSPSDARGEPFAGSRLRTSMSEAFTARLDAYQKRVGATPASIILAAYAIALQRFYRRTDLVIGVAVDQRRPGSEDALVGFCANAVPVRLILDPSWPCEAAVKDVTVRLNQALDKADTPLEEIIRAVNPPRDAQRPPLFQAGFQYQPAFEPISFGSARIDQAEAIDTGVSRLDLTLEAGLEPGGLWLSLEFRHNRLSRDAAEALLGATKDTLLDLVSSEPSAKVSQMGQPEVPPAPPAPVASAKKPPLLADRLVCLAETAPHKIVLTDGETSLSAKDVFDHIVQAGCALAGLGLKPGARIGICTRPTIDGALALLSVMRAGFTYVPIDPDWPDERIRTIVQSSRAECLLAVNPSSLARLSDLAPRACLISDLSGVPIECPTPVPPAAEDTAYLIYTSGSSGRPKGVKVSHRALARFLLSMDEAFEDLPGPMAACTSIAFDVSLLETVWAVSSGKGSVCAVPRRHRVCQRSADGPDLSLFFFGGGDLSGAAQYEHIIDCARIADEAGFRAIWTPERHFNVFGGLYPNPSVLGAALARETRNLDIRAGSVVAPLHHPVRIAEEWALVDNLSHGRAGFALASGWHADDFVLRPEAFEGRREAFAETLAIIRRLWRGETVRFPNGAGHEIDIRLHPNPVQPEPQIWITVGKDRESFSFAGRTDAGVLTHLIELDLEGLALRLADFKAAGTDRPATLMVHAFASDTLEDAYLAARPALRSYLSMAGGLIKAQAANTGDIADLSQADQDAILDLATERYLTGQSLIGDDNTVMDRINTFREAGVDEIACLIDFGVQPDAVRRSVRRLGDVIKARGAGLTPHKVDALHPVIDAVAAGARSFQTTPSQLRLLLDMPQARAAVERLDQILVGGERLTEDLAGALDALGVDAVNMYGPTEATIWATYKRLERGAKGVPPIGQALPGYHVSVRDEAGRPARPYHAGEIWIAGDALADGYDEAGSDEHTFIQLSGHGAYRTGDVGYCDTRGDIHFVGRRDSQIKLRGVRLEPGEVEAAALALEAVKEAACVKTISEDGEALLQLAFAPAATATASVEDVQAALRNRLPRYALPDRVVAVDALPYTTSGKIDRNALATRLKAKPLLKQRIAPAQEACSGLVSRVRAIWAEMLNLDHVAPDADFFASGGHSLLAVRLVNRCQTTLGGKIALADFFEQPTPLAMARLIEASRGPSHD